MKDCKSQKTTIQQNFENDKTKTTQCSLNSELTEVFKGNQLKNENNMEHDRGIQNDINEISDEEDKENDSEM